MDQLLLWNDVRVPQEYHEHFLATGKCLNCCLPLRHTMHAFNHYKRHHLNSAKRKVKSIDPGLIEYLKNPPTSRQKHFVWYVGTWVETDFMTSLYEGVFNKRPTAHTKIQAQN